VFLDPPYKEIGEYHHILRLLGRSHLLDSRSLVIAEHSRHCFLEEEYGNLHRDRLIRHGDAQLGFYRVK
jgi:16S rRNA G966 N2-methylase RsmD